jgi:ABC-type lipoprotein release transport system permease subunit
MTLYGIWELKKIALRNLLRHKVKTVLTAMAIMVSVAVFIFLNCWLGGTSIESRRNIVQYELGAAKLQTKLYFDRKDEMPSYENFLGWEDYQKALAKEAYNSSPRYVFTGTLFSLSGSIPVLFHGIDPELEAQTLRWTNFIDFGRYLQSSAVAETGNFEIVLGTVAAERLKVGIPGRPLRLELEALISEIAHDPRDAELISSLYEQARKRGMWDLNEVIKEGNERLVLKKDASRADLDRYWDLVAASGRNDLRINAVIDMRAVPETIRTDRFEVELMEALRAEDRSIVQAAYEYFDLMGAYVLIEDDPFKQEIVLDAMICAGFTGAVRSVFQVFDVKVVGIINSPAPLPNSNTAYIPLDVLQDERGMMLQGAVTELVINDSGRTLDKLPGASESAAAITAALERGLGRSLPSELAVRTWQDYSADYLSYERTENALPNVVVFLLLVLSFLGISNTILLAIMERTKETGMMRALGMTDGQMKLVYMLEAGFIGFFGSILGIIAGCAINYPMVLYGVDFSAMSEIMGEAGLGFRVVNEYRSTWNIGVIIGSGIVATILSFLVAYFPTRKALKLSITDSLRFE